MSLSKLRVHKTLRAFTAVAACMIVAACGGGIERVGSIFSNDEAPATGPVVTPVGASTIGGVPVEQLAADQLCPDVTVREGTQTLRIHAPNQDRTPQTVRYQAQILQTAAECTPAPGQLGLTLGVAGRAILGPLGQPASLDLPVRVVIIDRVDGTVLASEIVRTTAIIEPTEVSTPFTIVNRSFIIPRPERQGRYAIIVGFDETEA